MTNLKIETLKLEEIEALNLKDVENLDQETASEKWGYQDPLFKEFLNLQDINW